MASCILSLPDHPEVVKRAQFELDRIIGSGHLPDSDDEPSLPYITTIVKEALRWNDATPMGMFVVSVSNAQYKRKCIVGVTTEDEYKGYCLPAGSIVVVNRWYVCFYPAWQSCCSKAVPGQFFITRKCILILSRSILTVS